MHRLYLKVYLFSQAIATVADGSKSKHSPVLGQAGVDITTRVAYAAARLLPGKAEPSLLAASYRMIQQLPDRPCVIFDGDCSFWRAWIEYWK
jgi:hypothetical protein